ncbi:MAG: restriction endonuclease [Cupriavidus sp.]|nr:restriction endonuclease [Cupriavidus sp.]
MGRRRKPKSLSEELLESPWWVSALFALGSYVVFYAVVPGMLAGDPILVGVAAVIRSVAWAPPMIFAFVGLLSFVRERRQAQTVSAQRVSSRLRPVGSPKTGPHREWSIDALKQLEWKRFELLCVAYYEAMGFKVKTVPHGPDGGIDATLYKAGIDTPLAVVQCKAWNKPVKVEQVRALGGVMHEHKVRRGVFWSLSGYVGRPVQESAERAGIQLLDGAEIVERIRALPAEKQAALLAQAFKGDYRTPTCAACGVKMIPREFKGRLGWGCRNRSCGTWIFRAA